jgi:hypothetical protein
MDPEVIQERFLSSAVLIGGAAAVGALASWLVRIVGRRVGLSTLGVLAGQVAIWAALLAGGSLYLDAVGEETSALVTAKEERIRHRSRPPGYWSRSYWAQVEFAAAGRREQAWLWLDEPTYDTLRRGAEVPIRYLPRLPYLARPASSSTLTMVPWRWVGIGAAAIGALWLSWTMTPRRLRVVPAVVMLAAGLAVVAWLLAPSPWDTPLEGPTVQGLADVRHVRTVTQSVVRGSRYNRIRAAQPWNVVELSFVPEGRDDPVVAVDSVDVGSVPNLEVGARVPVTYNPAAPRDVRLPGARTYRQREWQAIGEYLLAIAIVVGGLIVGRRVVGNWWRRRTRRA